MYTAATLISNAFTLSNVVSRDFNTVSGPQETEGLALLNAFLAMRTADKNYIPYYQQFDFTAVIGQELYNIPNLIDVETFTFNIGVLRYSLMEDDRFDYFGTTRVDNIQTLPDKFRLERCLGGMNVYVYPLPADTYPMHIWGKFSLADVTLDQDLELTLDKFYIEYLRYELADMICSEYNISLQKKSSDRLDNYRKVVNKISPPDLTTQKMSCFTGNSGWNWGDINLGRGWRP